MMSPEHALSELQQGNQRFVKGMPLRPRQDAARRTAVATAQRPLAVVVGCADSRVPPEILFDTGIGDLFVLRTAGHLIDDRVLGGIEFGVTEFGPQLVVVLAHTRCGAVSATLGALRSGQRPAGYVGSIVEGLTPALESVAASEGGDDAGIHANLVASVERVRTASPVLAERIAAGTLRVVGMRYNVESGETTLEIP